MEVATACIQLISFRLLNNFSDAVDKKAINRITFRTSKHTYSVFIHRLLLMIPFLRAYSFWGRLCLAFRCGINTPPSHVVNTPFTNERGLRSNCEILIC